MGFEDFFKIIFKPKSILAFLVAAGVVFLLIGGLFMAAATQFAKLSGVAWFFIAFGTIFTVIGIIGWMAYVLKSFRGRR